ncbi:hypothetical protein CQA66_01925 [Helicobacter aurati]|uniref:Uncharacterized protein n=1 Tax=Helicobacter aurati TaxID=137778 RepID=A0A3D8J7G0_9HELI|nr:hypothetical protein [Helicobacter aurati]RDU73443.1 hypothetical protein CQA66_01925 [Helicobacter aurati]
MSIKSIRLLFIIGITINIIASLVEVFSIRVISYHLFFFISMVGHSIFAAGLWFVDKVAKSLLCSYYLAMMIVGCLFYCLQSYQFNSLVILLCALFFLFLVFKYLNGFTQVSGNYLFISSFYCLIVCCMVGVCLLKFSNVVDYRATVSFIVGFMIFPAFIVYIVAILNFKTIRQR